MAREHFGLMRRFEGLGSPGMERLSQRGFFDSFSPEVDMFKRNGKLVITADLPGMSKDDVRVEISDDYVILEGERKYAHEESEEGVYRSERGYGEFRRQILLPEGVKPETASANFKNGVLEITMEVPSGSKNRRRIQIHGKSEKAA
jgi:HSP20 family protein